VNQYFRPYVDVVGPEDTIHSEAPATVPAETKPRTRPAPSSPAITAAPARKANPYAKYWDRPVGQSHVESKAVAKGDMADSPAGPSRPTPKAKNESSTKTIKPKPIIKNTSTAAMDGTAGMGHKRTASGAGLTGPGDDQKAEDNAQKAGQKKKRTIESGMPKLDKGYTHLIPDCIGESRTVSPDPRWSCSAME